VEQIISPAIVDRYELFPRLKRVLQTASPINFEKRLYMTENFSPNMRYLVEKKGSKRKVD